MALTAGTRIGPYEIIAPLGAGGMGEVYRARDPHLQRDVAIKLLPDAFAGDPERLARFQREARVLAALDHPNVAQVYGVQEVDGRQALVMECVTGEDLAERLSRGPLPTDDALRMAMQIAEGIEAAHEQGIIHRDLKPSNIRVRPDGRVKVLDFGLAKQGAADSAAPAAELMNSPTVTSPFATAHVGILLGTAAYMAPEQAKGQPADRRADVWAFGCVLYEMLTGRRAFSGSDATETLAAIIRSDPDWSALPDATPAPIVRLLKRCLRKDRRQRLPDIGAARLELEDACAEPSGAPASSSSKGAERRQATLPWMLAAVATLIALALAAYALIGRPHADTAVFQAQIVPPAALSGAPILRLALSPDGSRLAFVAPDAEGRTVLWLRPLDSNTAAHPVPGTQNASAPFWSPDGRLIGFQADGWIKHADLGGSTVVAIAEGPSTPAAAWNRDGVLLFTTYDGSLARIPAGGGESVRVTTPRPEAGEAIHYAPQFLPDQRRFLYTAGGGGSRARGAYVGSLDSAETQRVLDVRSNTIYASGYLLFLRGPTLMAQRFDPDRLRLSGEAKQVATGVQINPGTGTGAFAVSQNGVLVYQTGSLGGTQLTWFDRSGKAGDTLGGEGGYRDIRLSPDGASASATLLTEVGSRPDVWLFDLRRSTQRRFTFEGDGSMSAVWSPDGRQVFYGSRRNGNVDLFRKDVLGTRPEESLLADRSDKYPLAVSPGGQYLLYSVPRTASSGKLWVLPLAGPRIPRPVLQTEHSEVPAAISPNGRWLAYVSDETGRREVYVTSFPEAAGKWQVSTTSGDNPVWSADGQELFYVSGFSLLSADVQAGGPTFEVGGSRKLLDVRVPAVGLATGSTYAVAPDGSRFLVNSWHSRAALEPITLVVNWPSLLDR